jgi:hypothetical protein
MAILPKHGPQDNGTPRPRPWSPIATAALMRQRA